jgi:hypothetical protein
VSEHQLGRTLRCSKCGGRFLADTFLPPDVQVEDYAGEAPPVQVPQGQRGEYPAPEPPPLVRRATRRQEAEIGVVVNQDRHMHPQTKMTLAVVAFAIASLGMGFVFLWETLGRPSLAIPVRITFDR